MLWGLLSVLIVRFGPPGIALLMVALGIYLVGPLWVPAVYRLDDMGVHRRTPFGARVFAWETLGEYGVRSSERTAWIALKGRGTARLLPPVLLLWEEIEGPEFRARLAAVLAARLGAPAGGGSS